jgi:TPR repeat protein
MNLGTVTLFLHSRLQYQGENRNPPGIEPKNRRENQLSLFLKDDVDNLLFALRYEDVETLKELEKEGVEDAKHFREWFENKEVKMKPSDPDFLSLYCDAIFAGDERNKILTLAGRYNSGRNGVIKDKAKAKEWYQIGANNGSGKAMHNLACALCEDGRMEDAKKWILRAIEKKWAKVEKSKILLTAIEAIINQRQGTSQ